MNSKKINTVPNGVGIVVIIWLEIFLTLLVGLSLLPKIEAIGVFGFTLMFGVALMHYLALKHWNFIEISRDGVRHRKESYIWENVFITVKCCNPKFARNNFDYYAYFDDHFLTDTEIDSKSVKKKGFYIILTSKRVDLLLPNYQKEVNILNESTFRENAKITNKIKLHNELIAKR